MNSIKQSITSLITLLFAVLCSSCAEKETTPIPAYLYEEPSFTIGFSPISIVETKSGDYAQNPEPDVSISERPSGVRIRVGRLGSGDEELVHNLASYRQLKRMILNSKTWAREASENYYSLGVYTGPARDILVIRHEDKGVCLQGDRVPSYWRNRIMRFAAEETKAKK